MMNLAEYRNRNPLADFLPWAALVGGRRPQQGRLVPAHRALSRSRSRQRRAGRAGRRRRPPQQRLRRLGSGWAIFVEAQRHPAATYPEALSRSASALVDARAQAPVRGSRRAFRVAIS
jgi:hypothetical protein